MALNSIIKNNKHRISKTNSSMAYFGMFSKKKEVISKTFPRVPSTATPLVIGCPNTKNKKVL